MIYFSTKHRTKKPLSLNRGFVPGAEVFLNKILTDY